uniref:Uncharacterized protein n=1 Tax=Panagrolaimus superbus TaxID=310955 RepID=A0A914YBL3_9BILA
MSVDRVSTAEYTIPSIRTTKIESTQPPSLQNAYNECEKNAEDEGTIRGFEKKSDAAQSSSNILTISQSLQGSSIGIKDQQQQQQQQKQLQQKHSIPTTTSKDKLKTAEHVIEPPKHLQSQNQNQKQQSDPTQTSAATTQASSIQQKPKNSVSPPQTISPSAKNSAKNNYVKSGSYMKVDSAYKRANANLRSPKSRSNTTLRDVASLDTAISESSLKPSTQSTKTCIEWDEKKIVTKVNLNSKKAPQIFCFNIRWILLIWGLLLCCYDSTMLMTNIFSNIVFLEHTYHFIFILTFPSGPALFYLMISEKVKIFCWKTHISCQIFRILMNIYLFLDYYCAWLDSLDELKDFQQITIQYHDHEEKKWIPKEMDTEIEKNIRIYFAVSLSILGIVTVLTIIFFGFAMNLYYYEKEALKRKQEKWRRRINKILESHQTFIPPETEEMSSDIASSTKLSLVSKK